MKNSIISKNIDIAKIEPNKNLELLFTEFLMSQDVKKSSRELYGKTLKQFFKWLFENNLLLSKVSRSNIIKYKEDLFEDGLSSLTVASYITTVRKFFEWTETQKIYPNVAKGIKNPRRKQQFKKQALSVEMGQELLEYFETECNLRDFAMVNLMIRTGLRTIEVSRANVEDITFKSGKRVLLVHGKGRDEKDDFVILSPKAYDPIKRYLKERGKTNRKEPLFISVSRNDSKGKKLSTRSIRGIVKKGMIEIGLDYKEFTAHSLRHTTAVTILRAGGKIEDAQNVLRHTSPATTQIYTESIKEEQRLKNSVENIIDDIL